MRAVIARNFTSKRRGVANEVEVARAKAVADYYGINLDVIDWDARTTIPRFVEQYKPIAKAHNTLSLANGKHGLLSDYISRNRSDGESVFAGEISDGVFKSRF